MTGAVRVRPAAPGDAATLVALVRELADYERGLAEVQLDEARVRDTLFAASPAVFATVAEVDEAVAGFAVWFVNYSTWLGRHGIYLEDLYVRPAARRHGVGQALFRELARVATARGFGRLDFAVLDWNEPAMRFYRAVGAEPMTDWRLWRVGEDGLRQLAGR